MQKIVIISCTNRPGSNTLKVCNIYQSILKSLNIEAEIFDMRELPENIAFGEIHGKRTKEYSTLIEKYVTKNNAFIFVIPEYNGSFPGLLKLFIDTVHPREWAEKSACLVGVSDGRAGNLRGMEHFMGILNYVKVNVYHNKLPISRIVQLLDEKDNFNHPEQLLVCRLQLEGFLKFLNR